MEAWLAKNKMRLAIVILVLALCIQAAEKAVITQALSSKKSMSIIVPKSATSWSKIKDLFR